MLFSSEFVCWTVNTFVCMYLFSCLWNAGEFIVTGELSANRKAISFPDMDVVNGCDWQNLVMPCDTDMFKSDICF